MNRRLLLGVGLALLLAASAGCLGLFGNGISDSQLDRNATYDWHEVPDWSTTNDTVEPVEGPGTTDVFVNVTGESYYAIYHIDNRTDEEFEVWTRGISNDNPVDISALRFRYPNGTTLNGSQLRVYKTNYRTHVVLPTEEEGDTVNGTLAFSGPAEPKHFRLWNYMEGTHEVVLPSGFRTSFFLFGQVVPSADNSFVDDDNRLHLEWTDEDDPVSGRMTIKYYLQRDYYIFTGTAIILGLAALVGMGYYWYQIRELTELREEMGFDSGDGPG